MRILLVGIDKTNINYRKIEGFYNAFSKIGRVEWVTDIFLCCQNSYDIVFGEISIDYLIERIEDYKGIKITYQIFWSTNDINKLKFISNARPDVKFLNAYKSNIFDKSIVNRYMSIWGDRYQNTPPEGVNLGEYINIDMKISDNLSLCYLPCCLSEKEEFVKDKPYDICYFGTISNRPNIKRILDSLSSKYNILTSHWDIGSSLTPAECYNLYKKTKLTLSEQVYPVQLEFPVRLGESTSTGCEFLLLSEIDISDNSLLVPKHNSYSNIDNLIVGIEEYLANYTIDDSIKIYKKFNSTYDIAVEYILEKINIKK